MDGRFFGVCSPGRPGRGRRPGRGHIIVWPACGWPVEVEAVALEAAAQVEAVALEAVAQVEVGAVAQLAEVEAQVEAVAQVEVVALAAAVAHVEAVPRGRRLAQVDAWLAQIDARPA